MKIPISQKSITTSSGNPEKCCLYGQTVWQHE